MWVRGLKHAVQKANIGMVAQIACIHAQGFGIICVSLHHIVAKAPCIARGTMLKPGFVAGLHFVFVVHDYHCRKHIKNARNRCEIGRFVYIFVYKFRKSLKINVYCGERGRRYRITTLRNLLITNSCTSLNSIFFALVWRRTGARQIV